MLFMMTRSLFVTGTDTGVGKTRVSCAVLHAMAASGVRAVGMKPVASDAEMMPDGLRNEDALALQQAANVDVPYDVANPYCFAPAIAPHLAARQAGVDVSLTTLLAVHQQLTERAECVVVEGAGGWRVPLSNSSFLSDLPRQADMDVLLVVGLRLGCINHAVLTAEAIRHDGCRLVGWVGNAIDPGFAPFADNLATLNALLPAPCWGVVPHGMSSEIAATMLTNAVRSYLGQGVV